MIRSTPSISIDDNDIQWAFIRASGPGGQHVNKAATAVQLRLNVDQNPNLPPDVRHRLKRIAGNRMAADGTLIIDARRFRSQSRNREDALTRVAELIRNAAKPPVPRKKNPTVPDGTASPHGSQASTQQAQTAAPIGNQVQ